MVTSPKTIYGKTSDLLSIIDGYVAIGSIMPHEKTSLLIRVNEVKKIIHGSDDVKRLDLVNKLLKVMREIHSRVDELSLATILSFLEVPSGTIHPIVQNVEKILPNLIRGKENVSSRTTEFIHGNIDQDKAQTIRNVLTPFTDKKYILTTGEIEPLLKIQRKNQKGDSVSSKKYLVTDNLLRKILYEPSEVPLGDTLMLEPRRGDEYLLVEYKRTEHYKSVSDKYHFLSIHVSRFSSDIQFPAATGKDRIIDFPTCMDQLIKEKLTELSTGMGLDTIISSYKKSLYFPMGNSSFASILVALENFSDIQSEMLFSKLNTDSIRSNRKIVLLEYHHVAFLRLEQGMLDTVEFYLGTKRRDDLYKILKFKDSKDEKYVLSYRALFWAAIKLIIKRGMAETQIDEQKQRIKDDVKNIFSYVWDCFQQIKIKDGYIDEHEFARIVMNNDEIEKGLLSRKQKHPLNLLLDELWLFLETKGY